MNLWESARRFRISALNKYLQGEHCLSFSHIKRDKPLSWFIVEQAK